MSLAFLSPLLLGAAALAAIPWLLHHIRRPERETVRFSSLMFVPVIKKEVIERRRLQHLLLMLLRMAIVVLLAFAFARPFVPILAGVRDTEGLERHVVLLDTSYSMGAAGAFEAAKEAARAVLSGLGAGDRVAVVAFSKGSRELAPMGSPRDALLAIDGATLSHDSTDFEAALRRAVDLLTAETSGPEAPGLFLHLITDFQRQGMPERATGWRVPANVAFHPVEIATPADNRAVSDLAVVEAKSGQLQLKAKIRNWSRDSKAPVAARLVTAGQVRDTRSVEVAPGNASQVAYEFPASGDAPITGWIEIDDPALDVDNRRYFAWNPKARQRVLVVDGSPESSRWPAAKILEYALPDLPGTPWSLRTANQLADLDLDDCDVLILAGPTGGRELLGSVVPFVEKGGSLLVCLPGTDTEPDDAGLLRALGLETAGMRYADASNGGFTLLSWIDFEHPVFHPFADPRFNDFSDVRFYNHRLLNPLPAPDPAAEPRIVARFEPVNGDPGPPAVVEIAKGAGRVLVWAFPLDLQWTTLPKSPHFVPVLYESLAHLAGETDNNRAWQIGDRAAPPRRGLQPWQADAPGSTPTRRTPDALDTPGYLEWRAEGEESPAQIDAVNLFAAEGDPARVTPDEFALRLCSAPLARATAAKPGPAHDRDENAREYGAWLLGLTMAALLLESWYASRLALSASSR